MNRTWMRISNETRRNGWGVRREPRGARARPDLLGFLAALLPTLSVLAVGLFFVLVAVLALLGLISVASWLGWFLE